MVFQSYALYPHMTVAENIGFHLKVKKMAKSQRAGRVREAARILDLDELLDRRPANLSGGQRQRVAMGRAIVREPQVFLMDEPLSNLDAKLRVQTRTQIAALQRDLGVTTVYVTHDQIEAMTLATHAGVLVAGRLLQVGSPRELYERPATVEVAMRLGIPRINLLPADLFGPPPAAAERLGIRAEHLQVGHGRGATVQRIEHLGDQTRLHLRIGSVDLITLTDPHTAIRVGDEVSVRPTQCIYFDAQGQRIPGPPS